MGKFFIYEAACGEELKWAVIIVLTPGGGQQLATAPCAAGQICVLDQTRGFRVG